MYDRQHLHPITILLNFLKIIKETIAAVAVIFVLNIKNIPWNPMDPHFKWTLLGLLIAFFLVCLLLVLAWVFWRKYTYWVENEELHVEKGLFVKKHQYVPFERIQSVNFKESIFHRPFGLVKVTIETAGSEDSGIALTAISREQADWIDAATKRAKRHGTVEKAEQEEITTREMVYHMTTKNLLILATTSSGIGVIFSAVAAVMSQLSDVIPYELIFNELKDFMKYGILIVSLIVFTVLFISWLISVVITYLNHANFIVEREQDRLFISKGLLEKKRVAVPMSRIQGIKIVETPLRQLFGFAAIHLESAGNTEEDGDSKISLVPLIKKREALELLSELFPTYQFEHTLVKAPKRAAWRFMVFFSAWAVIPVALVSYFVPLGYGLYSLVVLPLLMLFGYAEYRSSGFALHDKQLTLVTRRFSKESFFVMKQRIQTMQVRQSVLAERGDLARLHVSIVAGTAESETALRFFEKHKLMQIFDWYRPARRN